jgi:hypothetical protein
MKKVLIALGIAAVIGGVLLIFVLFKAAGVVREAHGRALYSSAGAWTRIQEFARSQGKTNYIVEADRKLGFIENDLKEWRQGAEAAGLDVTSFEKLRAAAYETTDRNIKNGQNPLAYLDAP